MRLGPQVQTLPRRSASQRVIHVVAGVVYDTDGRILIAQRPAGKQLAGGWEFPGGKLESGEARRAGLARELKEELGIVIGVPRPLLRLTHSYAYGELLLDAWVVRNYSGTPAGLDGQALRWCRPDELAVTPLLPADAPIVGALRLPEVVEAHRTDAYEIIAACDWSRRQGEAQPVRRAPLLGVLCGSAERSIAAVTAGASFLVLRDQISDQAVRDLCEGTMLPVYIKDTSLEQAWSLGATGIHRLEPLDKDR